MSEPTIICPNCKTEIRLTESLAAPIIEATRLKFEEQISLKELEVANRELAIKSKERTLDETRRQIEDSVKARVEEQVAIERARVAEEEAAKAKRASASDLESKARELADLKTLLNEREEKLAEAQNVQAELIRKQRDLDDAKREFELTIEKRVQDSLQDVRVKAKNEVEQQLGLKVLEKDQTIASMQKTIAELKQKSEQGSQQLQGEVLELELENLLRARFPFDTIQPVAKGEFGGDILQTVLSPSGQKVGSILWESKRTKNWSDTWLVKLREDQRSAKAEVAILVSQVLPKASDTFDMVEGVWVTTPKTLLPVAMVIRESLVQIGMARQASEGQQTKTEMVYQYLTGPRFRQRVEAIVEAFSSMQSDLDRERRAIMKQWSKREEQIQRVMGATVGMWGDFQGIVGQSLHEIKGLELDEISDDSGDTKALPET